MCFPPGTMVPQCILGTALKVYFDRILQGQPIGLKKWVIWKKALEKKPRVHLVTSACKVSLLLGLAVFHSFSEVLINRKAVRDAHFSSTSCKEKPYGSPAQRVRSPAVADEGKRLREVYKPPVRHHLWCHDVLQWPPHKFLV